jgi:hypothetical protein
METWTVLQWSFSIAGGIAAIYGLHRLALWMEERGLIYYLHKKPKSSPIGSFVALQKIIEPQAQHVVQVSRINHEVGEAGASGRDRGSESIEGATRPS